MDEPARLTESIKELLGAGRTDRLADLLEEAHAADVATALMAVNAIAPLCAAPPGVCSFLELPLIRGRTSLREG